MYTSVVIKLQMLSRSCQNLLKKQHLHFLAAI